MSDSTPNTPTKRCSKCGVEYPATTEFFSKKVGCKYGVNSCCKRCSSLYSREYLAAHREEQNQKKRIYHALNRERDNARNLENQRKNHAHYVAYQHKYRALHHEELLIKKRLYHETEAGKRASRAGHQRRRARKAGNGGSYTPDELKAVVAAHTDGKGRLRCALCGKVIKGDYHIDHFVPLAKGGTNEAGNLRITHPRCNMGKYAKHPHKLGILI